MQANLYHDVLATVVAASILGLAISLTALVLL
jgi:hypothetical protein